MKRDVWVNKIPPVETPITKDGTTSQIAVVVWFIMGMTSILVIIRTAFHLFRGRRYLRCDDCFLLAALLFLIGNGVTIWEWLQFKYEPDIFVPTNKSVVLISSLMGTLNSIALACSKTSLGLTFARLTFGYWSLAIGVTVFIIDVLLAVQAWSYWVDNCYGSETPVPYRVQYTDEAGCVSFQSIWSLRLVIQILSCGLDAYFTYLPWKIVRPLELKRFEKIGLGIAMSFGAASLASGLARLVTLLQLFGQSEEHQPLYAVGGFVWNYIEPGLTIVAACIPVLRKVIVDMVRMKRRPLKFNWTGQYRRKKRTARSELPMSEFSRISTLEGKTSSEATYVAVPTPTVSNTSSRGCTSGDAAVPPMPGRKLRLYYTPPQEPRRDC